MSRLKTYYVLSVYVCVLVIDGVSPTSYPPVDGFFSLFVNLQHLQLRSRPLRSRRLFGRGTRECLLAYSA